jgi:hypothetical protein
MKPNKHPVAAAVEPLKVDAIKYAADRARREIEHVRKKLDEHGGDINKAAPYPDSRLSRNEYAMKKAIHDLFHRLTRRDPKVPTSYMPRAPYIVEMDDVRCVGHIEDAERAAAAQYDAFVLKLVHKIGPCRTAKLEGNHIWGDSLLRVTFADKAPEKWRTRQIDNRSKLGLWFNQWPSRKVK